MGYGEGLDSCQESLILLASARGHVGTTTNQGFCIDYITEKPERQHQLGMRRAPILGY